MSKIRDPLWMAALAFALFLGCPTVDETADDDDDTMSDDDSAEGDDDATSDDDSTGDDDSSGDDDSTGDDDDSTGDDDDSTGDDDTDPPPDLAASGPYAVTATAGMFTPELLCFMGYTVFAPVGAPAAPTVMLAHGFQRYAGVMEGLAEHYASWGLTTVTMDLCHATVIDSDPPADAELLLELGDELGVSDVIYAGHSAGGLRSILAADQDPDAVAVLGLDLVDGDGLALAAAPFLTVPLYGLAGEPTDCNAAGNGLDVYGTAPEGVVVRVTEGDHCDFEEPTDWLCAMLCPGTNDQFTDDEIHAAILALSTGYLLWQSGLEPQGEDWWTPGSPVHDAYLASGAIVWP